MSQDLQSVAAARWKIAVTLTAIMMVVYFGFILLVAYDKPLLGALLRPGLSVGLALGLGVILVAWAVTWWYVRWANLHYDRAVEGLRR
jgi:uncharacterized membrane protein (DUF485 family)